MQNLIKKKITIALKGGIVWLSIFDNKGRTITAVPMDQVEALILCDKIQNLIIDENTKKNNDPDQKISGGASIRA